MKVKRLYIDKKQIAKILGIDESDFVITDVDGSLNSIEFTLVANDDVKDDEFTYVSDTYVVRRNLLIK